MENPFVFGESVSGAFFCNRKAEIARLEKDALAAQKIFLISARRLGKTSLIKTVLEKLKRKGLIAIFLDLEGFASYKEFLNAYLTALSRQATTWDKFFAALRNIIPGFRADIKMDELGLPVISLGYDYPGQAFDSAAQKIFDLPALIAKKRKKKMVVVFDEFQEILKLNGGTIEGKLRASIQHQRNVGYIFAGSKKHLLMEMANSPERPFYKVGPLMYLDKLPAEEFRAFIIKKFASGKIRLSEKALDRIMEFSNNIPYFVQMLCHEAWDLCFSAKRIEDHAVAEVLNSLIAQYTANFHLDWSRLILSKRQVLKAIACSGGENILARRYLRANDLGLPSNVSRTLTALVNEGYLDKTEAGYFFNDILFKEWIKRRELTGCSK